MDRVLIAGGGGREHALAWKLAQSPDIERVFVAPGNPGTAAEDKMRNMDIAADDAAALADFAAAEQLALVAPGPEAALVAGVFDRCAERGVACVGPAAAAAALEGSKQFAKEFMRRHRIPTAEGEVFDDVDAACDYIRARGAPIVVKADGLAAGKGVVVAASEDEAIAAARAMLVDGRFGAAGARALIEECLPGEELSFIVLCDGEGALPLASSQDHKALKDGDRGPNTGGMGAYSPANIDATLRERVMREIIEPTVAGMRADGLPYRGFLYAGLMIGPDGAPKVLEFNCRLGDPETQPIMMRLRGDLYPLLRASLNDGELTGMKADWDSRAALGVTLAAAGYPGEVRKGDPIELPEQTPAHGKIFHAGTALVDGRLVTDGGRVLCATALGETLAEARESAYRLCDAIRWRGQQRRDDIGHRALKRL